MTVYRDGAIEVPGVPSPHAIGGAIHTGIDLPSPVSGSFPVHDGSALKDSVRAWDLGATQGSNVQLKNTTLATVGTPVQVSPGLTFYGSGWDTNDSVARSQEWRTFCRPTTSTNPVGDLVVENSRDGGAWTERASFNATGASLTIESDIYVKRSVFIGGDVGSGAGGQFRLTSTTTAAGSNPVTIPNAPGSGAGNDVVWKKCYDGTQSGAIPFVPDS
jgi:hypothetical protein